MHDRDLKMVAMNVLFAIDLPTTISFKETPLPNLPPVGWNNLRHLRVARPVSDLLQDPLVIGAGPGVHTRVQLLRTTPAEADHAYL